MVNKKIVYDIPISLKRLEVLEKLGWKSKVEFFEEDFKLETIDREIFTKDYSDGEVSFIIYRPYFEKEENEGDDIFYPPFDEFLRSEPIIEWNVDMVVGNKKKNNKMGIALGSYVGDYSYAVALCKAIKEMDGLEKESQKNNLISIMNEVNNKRMNFLEK
jgi:hypothetical protein